MTGIIFDINHMWIGKRETISTVYEYIDRQDAWDRIETYNTDIETETRTPAKIETLAEIQVPIEIEIEIIRGR